MNRSTPSPVAAPGDEVADVFADALVTGIHAGDPALLSMRATFPRLVALEEQYGSVLKGLAVAARSGASRQRLAANSRRRQRKCGPLPRGSGC